MAVKEFITRQLLGYYPNKPPFVPEDLWTQAQSDRNMYDNYWGMLIQQVANAYNVSLKEAEEAQRKGIYRYYLYLRFQSNYSKETVDWYVKYVGLERFFPKTEVHDGR